MQQVPQWTEELRSLSLPRKQAEQALRLLEYAIVQRFPQLTLQELQAMIQLTPFEKTVAGQELIQIGIEKGIEQGIEKGIEKGIEQGIEQGIEKGIEKGALIGEIRSRQRFLQEPLLSQEQLTHKDMEALQTMLAQLDARLDL